MGLADRDYYREHTQELERQAEASASRFGGGGRRTLVIDADGTLGPEPIGLRWLWQTLCWCGIIQLERLRDEADAQLMALEATQGTGAMAALLGGV